MAKYYIPQGSRKQITLKKDSVVVVRATGEFYKERMGKVDIFINQGKQSSFVLPGDTLETKPMQYPQKTKIVVTTNRAATAILYTSDNGQERQNTVRIGCGSVTDLYAPGYRTDAVLIDGEEKPLPLSMEEFKKAKFIPLISVDRAPGEYKTITYTRARLFGRTHLLGDNFFSNWRNVYRHPIIWFLSK